MWPVPASSRGQDISVRPWARGRPLPCARLREVTRGTLGEIAVNLAPPRLDRTSSPSPRGAVLRTLALVSPDYPAQINPQTLCSMVWKDVDGRATRPYCPRVLAYWPFEVRQTHDGWSAETTLSDGA